jgi:PAP2 superfamily protein
MPGEFLDDTKTLLTTPEHQGLLLIVGAGSAYTQNNHDDQIADHFEGHHTFGRDLTIAFGTAGSPATHFALAGAGYVYNILTENQKGYEVSRSLIKALSLTGLITTGAKLAANNHCPNGEDLAWPSGHTSSTVTLATVMNEYYGPWVGIPLYALSGLVMYERMETGEHWASDVIFGAVIGYTVGKTVASKDRPKIFGMDLAPYVSESGAKGVVLVKAF